MVVETIKEFMFRLQRPIGVCLNWSVATLAGSMMEDNWMGYFVCAMLGGLVVFGAFCMAWPVGLVVPCDRT